MMNCLPQWFRLYYQTVDLQAVAILKSNCMADSISQITVMQCLTNLSTSNCSRVLLLIKKTIPADPGFRQRGAGCGERKARGYIGSLRANDILPDET
jgi:hypothetical protein